MSFKAWFKSKTADRVLAPLRNQVIDLIDSGHSVLEIGCGTGDLLFKASKKIELGLGVDLDQGMIEFANKRAQEENIENLEFVHTGINELTHSLNNTFDISTTTLCLHEMGEKDAIYSLSLLAKYTAKIVVADYAVPTKAYSKFSIEVDELISGHYRKFTSYRKNGGVPYLTKMAGLRVVSETETAIDGIFIWVLGAKDTHNE